MQQPGVWTAVVHPFHEGHEESCWAVELEMGGTCGPQRTRRLVVATSDPHTWPKASTWYLVTNLPLPATRRARDHPALPAADLAEVVRLYGCARLPAQWLRASHPAVRRPRR